MPTPSDDRPLHIGGFEIIAKLSDGKAGSAVYRAKQIDLNRDVALKMVPFAAVASQDRQLPLTSARAAAKLDHVHIVRLYSFGEHDGSYFFGMPYVPNANLAEHIVKSGPLKPDKALMLVRKVASALVYARQQGVPHPGLTPASILLDRDDEPRLIGFIQTQPATPSEADDVQRLGSILQSCISRTTASPRIDTICRKCSSSDPSVRYPSVAAMIADLDRNLSIDVSRRSRRLSVSIAAIVAIAIGGAVFGYSRWSVSQRRDEPPPNQPIHSNSAEPGGKTDENVERLPNFTMDPALRPGTPEMERAVAQWVIDCGGVVLVRPKVYNQLIKEKSSQLLNGDVRVTGISFSGRPVRDADLEPLVLLTALEILYLDGTQVGDKGVVQTLSGLTSLKYLSLERTAVTDASLSYLSRMIELHLRGTQTTSDGVARLAATNRSARILSGALPPPAYADMALREPNRKYALWFDGTTRVDIPIEYRFGQPISFEAIIEPEPQLISHVTIAAVRPSDFAGLIGIHFTWRPQVGWLFGMHMHLPKQPWHGTFASRQWKALPTGRKSHVAGVFDGKTMLHFRNGRLEGMQAVNVPIPDGPCKRLVVGRLFAEEPLEGFVGMIREFRVSSAARYDKDYVPTDRLEPDDYTLGLYHFDEGQGDVAKDSSGRQNHGKIGGARWICID